MFMLFITLKYVYRRYMNASRGHKKEPLYFVCIGDEDWGNEGARCKNIAVEAWKTKKENVM